MKELTNLIVKNIVDHPDKVDIMQEEDQGFLNLKLSVSPEDMGKVIGKGGKVIKAIRTLLKIGAIKTKQKVFLSLVEANKE